MTLITQGFGKCGISIPSTGTISAVEFKTLRAKIENTELKYIIQEDIIKTKVLDEIVKINIIKDNDLLKSEDSEIKVKVK